MHADMDADMDDDPGADPGAILADLLIRGDLPGLVREVDLRCGRREWDGVVALRDGCDEAAELTGRQLWGAAQYAEYRLALEAPAAYAADVLRPGGARFALGPLTEVAATGHTWDELADRIGMPVVAATVAQERVLRGEDLTGDERTHRDELELPLVLQPWEPDYPLPTYRADELLENGPGMPTGGRQVVGARSGTRTVMPELERALMELVLPWTEESSGGAWTVAVAGDAAAAVASLIPDDFRLIPITLPEAMARMAWAGASGGAHGRRRGMAAGRAGAFWVAHQVADLDFPADPDDIEFELEDRRWYLFDDGSEPTGWHLRLVVEDPEEGWACAIDAFDQRDDDPEPTTASEDES